MYSSCLMNKAKKTHFLTSCDHAQKSGCSPKPVVPTQTESPQVHLIQSLSLSIPFLDCTSNLFEASADCVLYTSYVVGAPATQPPSMWSNHGGRPLSLKIIDFSRFTCSCINPQPLIIQEKRIIASPTKWGNHSMEINIHRVYPSDPHTRDPSTSGKRLLRIAPPT